MFEPSNCSAVARAFRPAVLPDGRAIAYANNPGGLSDVWLQPLDGGPPERLTNFKADQIIAFDWSRDGRSLALVRCAETNDVVVISNAALK